MANILIRGARKFRNLMQSTISPFQSKVIILLYHRVFKPNLDPQLLSVTEKNFTEHLEYLSHNYNIMSLSGLITSLKEERLPKRGVVITFDDGYADNFLNAKPILDRYGAPATVFISTGRMFKARFHSKKVVVRSHGNVMVATAFLHGLAAEELCEKELDYKDPNYQVLITVRAVK